MTYKSLNSQSIGCKDILVQFRSRKHSSLTDSHKFYLDLCDNSNRNGSAKIQVTDYLFYDSFFWPFQPIMYNKFLLIESF